MHKIVNAVEKFLSTKYVLYCIVVLTAFNLYGYSFTNGINPIIVFGLIVFLLAQFSKNMSIILLLALIITSLAVSKGLVREGMESGTTDSTLADEDDTDKIVDDNIKRHVVAIKKAPLGVTKDNIKHSVETGDDANTAPETEPEAFEPTIRRKKGDNSRIDKASTLTESYSQLDKLLDSDGLKSLTQDTQQLMAQQQKLFKSVESMAPLISSTSEMLKGFDMSALSGLGAMAKTLTN